MDWKDVVGPLMVSAAPTIGGILGGLVPVPGGALLGQELGEALARQFGTEATPTAVKAAMQNTAPDTAAAKLQAAEAEVVARWPALAQIAQAQADVARVQLEQVNAAIIAEAQARVAAGDGIWGKWRAVHAFELTLECPWIAGSLLWCIVSGNQAGILGFANLSGLLITYLGARFGVLGVHVWQGSNERQTAISALPAAGAIAAVVRAGGPGRSGGRP